MDYFSLFQDVLDNEDESQISRINWLVEHDTDRDENEEDWADDKLKFSCQLKDF